MKIKLLLVLIVIYYISSCSYDNKTTGYSPFIYAKDTISLKLKYAESSFTIPSPQQFSYLIKECTPGFYENLVYRPSNSNLLINTTTRKSLMVGIITSDLSYLNQYNQKNLALIQINMLKDLMIDLGISQPINNYYIHKLEQNFIDHDSFSRILSQLLHNNDQYLKNNNHGDICVLIIVGGWIESFYQITQLYNKTNNSEIFNLILIQKEVIDNLIRMLSPYYEENVELAGLIDDLVNLAYEFDAIEFHSAISHISADPSIGFTIIHNQMNIDSSGSRLDNLIHIANNLHKKINL